MGGGKPTGRAVQSPGVSSTSREEAAAASFHNQQLAGCYVLNHKLEHAYMAVLQQITLLTRAVLHIMLPLHKLTASAWLLHSIL